MKKIIIIILMITILTPLVNAAILLNETFEDGDVIGWNNYSLGIATNSTNPIRGSYSGWVRTGSSWGYVMVNFTNSTTGNITLNFLFDSYNQDGGFLVSKNPPPATYYENGFNVFCGLPTANEWGYFNPSTANYHGLNISCNSGAGVIYNVTALVYGLGTDTKMLLLINGTYANTTLEERGTALSVGSFGVVHQQTSSETMIDNICICSGTWNTTCCDAATPPSIPEISFLNQTPNDITSTTLFSSNVFILYNYSNTTGITNTYLNYSITSDNQNCINIINNTCQINNNTYYQLSGINSSSADNQTIYNFTFGENQLLPANNQLNYTAFNQTHNQITLTSNSQIIKSRFYNFTNNTIYSFYEAMINGNCQIYYCNSSYSTGNPGSSTYCSQFYSGNITYNHSHNTYSNHSLITIPLNTSTGSIGGIKTTTESYILTRGTSANCNIYWVNNLTSTGTFTNSSNTGTTYTEITGTLDNHLHQFSNETITYAGCENKSGTINCTTYRSDNYGLDPLAPGGANIISPTENADITKYINLTFIKPGSPINATITQYNISILNNDLSFNTTITGNITQNNTINNNTEIAVLGGGTTTTNYSDIINLTINGYLNITSAQVKENGTSNYWFYTRVKYYYIDETTSYSNENRTQIATYYTINYTNPYPYKKVINYTLQAYYNDSATQNAYINRSIVISRPLINITENPTNISAVIDIHTLNLSIGNYYLIIGTTDNYSKTTYTTQQFNLTRDITFATKAYLIFDNSSIQNFTQNITDKNNLSTETKSTTWNETEFYLIKGRNYTSLISQTNYSFDIYNITTTSTTSSYVNYLAYLYTNNSISIYIYDSNNLSLINGTNITIRVTGSSITTYTTTNGTYYIDGLNDGNYSLKFTAANYSVKYYNIEVANSSHQNLYAYLVSGDYSTIFTIQSALTTLAIEGATFTAEILNGSSYVLVESLTSDLAGKIQMYYVAGEKYRFTISATDYSTKLFYLNPIIFSSYVVNLDPTTNTESPQDYADVSITYYPKTFLNNYTNNFTWLISSPLGKLTSYNFNLTYPSGNNGSSGNNANGETFTINLNITGANNRDRVNLTYNYTTASGGTKIFTYSFEIINTGESNNTIAWLKHKDYGLGSFEKALLVMLVLVTITGFAYLLTGMAGSLLLGLIILGVAVYLGFLPIWSILISAVVGIAIILKNSTGGQT